MSNILIIKIHYVKFFVYNNSNPFNCLYKYDKILIIYIYIFIIVNIYFNYIQTNKKIFAIKL